MNKRSGLAENFEVDIRMKVKPLARMWCSVTKHWYPVTYEYSEELDAYRFWCNNWILGEFGGGVQMDDALMLTFNEHMETVWKERLI